MTLGTAGTLEGLPEDGEYDFDNLNEDSEDKYDDEEEEESTALRKKRTTRAITNKPNITTKEEIIYDYDIKNYAVEKPMREVRFHLPFMTSPIIFNPLTTLIGMIPLWVTTIWCMVQPDEALENLVEIRGNIAHYFTWFIIITKPISVFFIFYISWRYGHIRFGGNDAKPEFGNIEYFTMIFSSGVGVGIFYYGVSEPLWHQSSHWFAEAGYRSQDEIDQMALLITLYHWGLHGWGNYIVVAIATSLASYRFRLPMVFRSTFYPILHEYTWGWMGDVLDGMGIVVTIAGICTSLGLGAIQMTAGVQKIGWLEEDLSESETTRAQIAIIWIVTIITTASVMMGLNFGIRYLSLLAFSCGILLTLIVFMMDQTSFLLNLAVQTMGEYFQFSIFQLPFHTDAFGQLNPGEGRAVDGNAAATWWFDAWTIFYWNWWVAWAVFVGLFIARISHGRTIREVTIYTLIFPLFYLITWFSVWGGAGIRQARQALELEQLGLTHYNDTEHFISPDNANCFDVPQENLIIGEDTIFENHLTGVTPVCKFYSTNEASFNVLYSFSFPDEWDYGYGPYLSILFLVSLAAYFATSSDSGSLVVDFLAANGRHDTHWIQRLFWALTEASVATALLSAGGSNALAAVQAASIICGLPYTAVLLYLLQSIYEMCEQALDEDQIHFKTPERQFIMPVYGGIFNVFEYIASLGNVHTTRVVLGLDLPSSFQTTEFFTSFLLPFLPLQDVVFSMYPKPNQKFSNLLLLISYTLLFFFWVTCLIISITLKPSMFFWGLAAYITCSCLLANLKHTVRLRRRLHGNLVGDLMSSFLLYPQVITQIRIELIEYGADQVEAPKKKKVKSLSLDKSGHMANNKANRRTSNASDTCSKAMSVDSSSHDHKSLHSHETTRRPSSATTSRRFGDDTDNQEGSTIVSKNAVAEQGGSPTIKRDRMTTEQRERAEAMLDASGQQHLSSCRKLDNGSKRRLSPTPMVSEGTSAMPTNRGATKRSAADIRQGLRARMEERKREVATA